MRSLILALSLVFLGNIRGYGAQATPAQLRQDIRHLQAELDHYRAQTNYIVIDTVHNRLQVRRQTQVLREAVCTTGSGKVLLRPGTSDQWQFNTPNGLRIVERKVTDPVWTKPLWAFVETGQSAPVLPWEFRRFDLTTLGAFALELGDGYEIHGTLYPGLLGLNISHGCIRLNDDDLAFVYHHAAVGDKVYIY